MVILFYFIKNRILISLPYRYLSVYHKKITLSILWFNYLFLLPYSLLFSGSIISLLLSINLFRAYARISCSRENTSLTLSTLNKEIIMAATKTAKSQKDLFFEKLAQSQQQQQQQPDAKLAKALRDAGSSGTKTTGIFVNQGIFHPELGVIALTSGTDSGYIPRKIMKFRNAEGELSEGQQTLAAKQAVSIIYTDFIQLLANTMLEGNIREMEINPLNIKELTEDNILINIFTKYQLGVTLVNTNVERLDAVIVNQSNLANLFA